jgi:hypothetical protein
MTTYVRLSVWIQTDTSYEFYHSVLEMINPFNDEFRPK